MNLHVQDASPHDRLGRYRLIAALGQGGMGMIHLAVAEGIGGFRKLFVIKELKRELCEDQQFLRLFMREAKLAALLSHPNVVHTVEADQDSGRYFLAMEFLDGRPFNEILRRAEQAPTVPLALRLQVICHALTGLHHAHELTDYDGRALQVVHRDVSPANIFVTYDGQVKVLDFGVATAASNVESSEPPAFKGKIGYAAPEQLQLRPGDRRADVFGCGVVLWEAIALRHLVRGRPSRQIFESRLLGTEPRIAQLIDDVDPRLAAICDRAMARDPDERYPTAEAFCRDLQGFLLERNMSVEPAQISALMRTKFAHERDTLHRLIEAQLGDEGEGTSAVLSREASSLGPEAGVQLVQRTTSMALHSVQPARSSRRQRLRAPALASLTLVALAGAAAWRLGDDPQKVPPAPLAAKPNGVTAASQSDLAQRAGAALRPKSADAGHAALPQAPPTRAQAQPRKAPSVQRERAPSPRVSPPAAAEVRPPAVEEPGALREQSSEVRGVAREQDAPAPERNLDIDLRRVPRRDRRSLDLENPFR